MGVTYKHFKDCSRIYLNGHYVGNYYKDGSTHYGGILYVDTHFSKSFSNESRAKLLKEIRYFIESHEEQILNHAINVERYNESILG